MAGWTLWQALPPRYQLTCKEVNPDNENASTAMGSSSPKMPRSPRTITPRQGSASARAKGADAAPTSHNQRSNLRAKSIEQTPNSGGATPRDRVVELVNGKSTQDKVAESDPKSDDVTTTPRGKATMYFTVTSPRAKPTECDKRVIAKSSFPPRRSSFINSFKQQQLINSMRQSFEDPSTVSPRASHRSTIAPNFPVTKFTTKTSSSSSTNYVSRRSSERPRQRAKTAVAKREHNGHDKTRSGKHESLAARRNQLKSAGSERTPNLYVSTILPLDTPVKPLIKNPLFNDKPPKRYVVRKLDDATMFIDDDKVIFIKKKTTKNDILQCQKTAEDTSYLAHLRKLYLREPKDLAKFMEHPDNNKKTLIRERLEYDKRVDNILNYYSRIDDRENAFAWAMSVEEANRNRDSCTGSSSARAQSSPGMRRESPSKPQTPVPERPATSRSVRKTDSSSELFTKQDALSDWNVFVKFNSQSILHERQFYLQTPMINPESKPEQGSGGEDCECRLCRLEMELGKQSQGGIELKGQIVSGLVTNSKQDVAIGSAVGMSLVKREQRGVGDKVNKNKSGETTMDNSTKTREDEALMSETSTQDACSPNIITKVDKSTSTNDAPQEKTAINLTIDLSAQAFSSGEMTSDELATEDYTTTTMQTFDGIDSLKTEVCYTDDKETNGIGAIPVDQRGDEETEGRRGDDLED